MSELKELTAKIKQFQAERDWEKYHSPKNIAISLVLEATEVLELFQWSQDNNLPKEKKEELSDELADCLYWVLTLADKFDIDLKKASEAKMIKNAAKYPISKAKGNAAKYNKL